MLPIYSFYNDITRKIINNDLETLPVEVNLAGGNGCGKTQATQDFINLLLQCDNIGILGVRKRKPDLLNYYLECEAHFKSKYLTHKTEMRITGSGKNTFFRFLSMVEKFKTTTSSKAGLQRFSNARLIVVICEECSELSEKDRSDIEIRVRGDNKLVRFLWINILNPYDASNYWVSYLNQNMNFNVAILKRQGYQYMKKDNKIFLYVNWRVARSVLPQQYIDKILNMWKYNKRRAMTADYGVPSADNDAIYSDCLVNLGTARLRESNFICGGIDIGLGTSRGSGITACLFGTYTQNIGFDVIAEYTHDNKVIRIDPMIIASKCIRFLMEQMRNYYIKTRDYNRKIMIVKVDNSDKAFINMLEIEARRQHTNNVMRFLPSKKKEVLIDDRVNYEVSLMSRGALRIDRSACKVLMDEFNQLKMKETDDLSHPKKRIGPDHCVTAMEYMFENYFELEYNIMRKTINYDKILEINNR